MGTFTEEERKPTQCEMILAHLMKYGSITQAEATRYYGCMRLAARISDIKAMHDELDIVCVTEKKTNKYGKKIAFGRYILKKKEEANEKR